MSNMLSRIIVMDPKNKSKLVLRYYLMKYVLYIYTPCLYSKTCEYILRYLHCLINFLICYVKMEINVVRPIFTDVLFFYRTVEKLSLYVLYLLQLNDFIQINDIFSVFLFIDLFFLFFLPYIVKFKWVLEVVIHTFRLLVLVTFFGVSY